MSDYVAYRYKALMDTSASDARKYLLAKGYFSQQGVFPGIISPKNLANVNIKPIDWSNKKSTVPRTIPIKLLGQKPNKGMREFSLLHPYSYILIVNELTEEKFWEEIREKLTAETAVQAYTIPIFNKKLDVNESAWQYFSTIDPARFYLTHPIEATLDIQNFYNSIYTHSIPWALVGKERAKQNIKDYTIIGNRLDKLFQNANDGQTNGIATGNGVSDLVSEIILKDIDSKISEQVSGLDARVFRYKDDYKVLAKDYQSARQLTEYIAATLNEEYGLIINTGKTNIRHVGSIDPAAESKYVASQQAHKLAVDGIEKFIGKELYYYIRDIASAHIYSQEKHYFDNCVRNLLTRFKDGTTSLEEPGVWAEISVYTLINAMDSGISTSTYSFALIDEILRAYSKDEHESSKKLLEKIVEYYSKSKSSLVKLWIYMIILSNDSGKAKTYLASNNSEIFLMAKNSTSPNVRFYSVRDPIDKEDLKELDKFELIKTEVFDEIEEKAESIINSVEEDDFDDWISFHYDF